MASKEAIQREALIDELRSLSNQLDLGQEWIGGNLLKVKGSFGYYSSQCMTTDVEKLQVALANRRAIRMVTNSLDSSAP